MLSLFSHGLTWGQAEFKPERPSAYKSLLRSRQNPEINHQTGDRPSVTATETRRLRQLHSLERRLFL